MDGWIGGRETNHGAQMREEMTYINTHSKQFTQFLLQLGSSLDRQFGTHGLFFMRVCIPLFTCFQLVTDDVS